MHILFVTYSHCGGSDTCGLRHGTQRRDMFTQRLRYVYVEFTKLYDIECVALRTSMLVLNGRHCHAAPFNLRLVFDEFARLHASMRAECAAKFVQVRSML